MNSPTSRIALITGASRGLGRSMALHLADHGADVIITYRTGAEEAQAVAAEVTARGRKAVSLPLDVADAAGFPAFADAVRSELRQGWDRERFDFLVNNAGVGFHAPFAQTTEEQFDLLMNVHLKGPFFLTQRLVPLVTVHGGGPLLRASRSAVA